MLRVGAPQPGLAVGVLGAEHVVVGDELLQPRSSAPWAKSRIAPGSSPMSQVGKTTPSFTSDASSRCRYCSTRESGVRSDGDHRGDVPLRPSDGLERAAAPPHRVRRRLRLRLAAQRGPARRRRRRRVDGGRAAARSTPRSTSSATSRSTSPARTTATAVSYVRAWHRYVADRPDLVLWGEYHDRWVRADDGWRIAERRVLSAGIDGATDPGRRNPTATPHRATAAARRSHVGRPQRACMVRSARPDLASAASSRARRPAPAARSGVSGAGHSSVAVDHARWPGWSPVALPVTERHHAPLDRLHVAAGRLHRRRPPAGRSRTMCGRWAARASRSMRLTSPRWPGASTPRSCQPTWRGGALGEVVDHQLDGQRALRAVGVHSAERRRREAAVADGPAVRAGVGLARTPSSATAASRGRRRGCRGRS